MKEAPLPYSLDPAPAYATLARHAATFSALCYEVTARGLEKLPIEMPIINGKRQPSPVHVFAALLARLDSDHRRGVCLACLPREFAGDVWSAMPQALEAESECARLRCGVTR